MACWHAGMRGDEATAHHLSHTRACHPCRITLPPSHTPCPPAGYDEGNLSWLAALEAEPATDVMALLPWAKFEAELTGPAAQARGVCCRRCRPCGTTCIRQRKLRASPCVLASLLPSPLAQTAPACVSRLAGAPAQHHPHRHPQVCRRPRAEGAKGRPRRRLLRFVGTLRSGLQPVQGCSSGTAWRCCCDCLPQTVGAACPSPVQWASARGGWRGSIHPQRCGLAWPGSAVSRRTGQVECRAAA